jgi:hypothetical protein
LRFRSTATRNAKRLLERPDFFASVDLHGGELRKAIRDQRSEDRNWNSSVATLGMQWTRSGIMKITRNIGMLLLAVYLIIDGLLGFGLNLGPAIFLLYIVALAAGILILIGK